MFRVWGYELKVSGLGLQGLRVHSRLFFEGRGRSGSRTSVLPFQDTFGQYSCHNENYLALAIVSATSETQHANNKRHLACAKEQLLL